MIKRNPYRTRKFSGADKMLKFIGSEQHYAQVDNPNVKWLGGTDGFAVSIVFQINTIPSVVSVPLTLRELGQPTTGKGYYIIIEPVDSNYCHVYFQMLSDSGVYDSFHYIVEKGKLYRLSVAYELPNAQNSFNATLISKLNGKSIIRNSYAVSTLGILFTEGILYFGRNAENTGLDTNLDGFLSSIIFFNDFVTEDYLDYIHNNNKPVTDKVSAFYSFNESSGGVIHDTGPLTQYDATLVNYSSPEITPGTQSVWYNIYTKTVLT